MYRFYYFVEDFFRSNSESIYASNLRKAASLLFIHVELFFLNLGIAALIENKIKVLKIQINTKLPFFDTK